DLKGTPYGDVRVLRVEKGRRLGGGAGPNDQPGAAVEAQGIVTLGVQLETAATHLQRGSGIGDRRPGDRCEETPVGDDQMRTPADREVVGTCRVEPEMGAARKRHAAAA